MKITLNWLKEHLETDASLSEITAKLTMLGLEIEEVIERSKGLEDFVVGQICEIDPHPNADKLQVCTIDVGSEILRVVCGATNIRKEMKCVFAAPGSHIPGLDVVLKKTKIRGVDSSGMLLSEYEMGLSENHEGIKEVDKNSPIGTSAVEAMGLDDPVIEIAITPNRGDCLGVRGIARDLAASGLGSLKHLPSKFLKGVFKSPINVHIDLDKGNLDACPQFIGRYIRNVKNVESPIWLKDRLLSIGIKPISALVDITNLMTIEYCRPLHVFDADKIEGDIHVRIAEDGEKILGLDNKEYALDSKMTIIADEKTPRAIAGILGGEVSGCTMETVNVFVESALFDPIRTATTGRRLNLQSDARFRFERGIDPEFLETGLEIATQLIIDICGGEASRILDVGALQKRDLKILFRPERIEELAGLNIDKKEMKRILSVLGFSISVSGNLWNVSVPSWRNDINSEACLVEEIVRVFGYDQIPSTPMHRSDVVPQVAWNPDQKNRSFVRRTLASRGLIEVVTLSFISSDEAILFGGGGHDLKLVNPISADLNFMRPSILPSLIAAAGRNGDRGLPDCPLFEVGPQFSGDDEDGQEIVAAGIRSGRRGRRNWAENAREVDVFDVKADAQAAISTSCTNMHNLQTFFEAPSWYHPGRSGSLNLGPNNILAVFGEIHPSILSKMNIKVPVVGFEVYLDKLPKPKNNKGTTRSSLKLSPFQVVKRDFAFMVDESVSAAALIYAAKLAEKKLIIDVSVFDLFQGGNLVEGQKSIALSITLQPDEKTLAESEIEEICRNIISSVTKSTGASLRS